MRMPRPLLLSLVLAVDLGCSTVASNDDDAGVTTNHGSDEGSSGDDDGSTGTSTGSTGTSTSTTEDGAQTDSDTDPADEGVKFDIPLVGDLPPGGDCNTAWLSWEQLAAVYPDCAIEPDGGQGCWTEPMIGCTPPGPDGCTCPDGNCLEDWTACAGDGQAWGETEPLEVCGPYVIDGLCCSIGEFTYGCAE